MHCCHRNKADPALVSQIQESPFSPVTMSRTMQVLSLGLPRTGSASLAQAFAVLGYEGIFHGINEIDNDQAYRKMGRAADGTFPSLPSYKGQPFTMEDWDDLYGNYDVTTDMASFFGPQLIKVYPDAKVVLVKRDYDAWYKSLDEGLLQTGESWLVRFHLKYTEPLSGLATAASAQKIMKGYFEAKDIDGRNSQECKTYL